MNTREIKNALSLCETNNFSNTMDIFEKLPNDALIFLLTEANTRFHTDQCWILTKSSVQGLFTGHCILNNQLASYRMMLTTNGWVHAGTTAFPSNIELQAYHCAKQEVDFSNSAVRESFMLELRNNIAMFTFQEQYRVTATLKHELLNVYEQRKQAYNQAYEDYVRVKQAAFYCDVNGDPVDKYGNSLSLKN